MHGISVIIPVFNQEKYLTQAIESVLTQNYSGKIEVIISDDGSTDRSLEIAESYYPKVIVLRKSSNCITQGVSGARNRGINIATQDYICFLDSDDFYLPDHLNKISTVLDNSISLGFAFCRMIEVREINNEMKYREWTQQKITINDILNPVITRSHIVSTNILIFKREAFSSVGLFNESYSNGEDGDLWMRISELFNGSFSNHFGAVYRTNHSEFQLTNNNVNEIEKNYIDIYSNAYKRYYLLNLKNPYRIFKLKLTLLRYECSTSPFYYYFRYLLLLTNYPLPFIKHLYENYLTRKSIKLSDSWNDFHDMNNLNN